MTILLRNFKFYKTTHSSGVRLLGGAVVRPAYGDAGHVRRNDAQTVAGKVRASLQRGQLHANLPRVLGRHRRNFARLSLRFVEFYV